jgi:hypothetical protein
MRQFGYRVAKASAAMAALVTLSKAFNAALFRSGTCAIGDSWVQ